MTQPTSAAQRPKVKHRLRILSWNVFVGHKPAEVHKALADMIQRYHPDVIVLTEAVHQQSSLGSLGYHVLHLPTPRSRPGRLQHEEGDTAILVKPGITIDRHWVMRLTQAWRGPKHGWPHAPRVYQVVRLRKNVQRWRVLGDHQPFGRKAVAESVARLRKWLGAPTKIPSIVIGDQNMRTPEFKKRVADVVGAEVGGPRIDLTAYKNCDLLDVRDLGAHGSDHHALLFDFVV